jgi:MtaA/CmuA family methyltransferase
MFFAQNRHGITYREFATNGRALADAQLGIRDKFPLDAITACSDAFRVTADLGAEMVYPEDRTPFAAHPLVKTESDFRKLGRPDPLRKGSRMADRTMSVKCMVDAVGKECLVLGWVDMPFAEACSVCGVTEFMLMLSDNPALAHAILRFLTDIVVDFSVSQLQVGAPMIGAGDAVASLISPRMYREFVLPYEKVVVDAIHSAGGLVKLHICGNTTYLLKDMIQTKADLFNVDHLVDFQKACSVYGQENICFKGNINPVAEMMQATSVECRDISLARLQAATGLRYMLSPGCEVPAETSDEVFQTFCEASQIFVNI